MKPIPLSIQSSVIALAVALLSGSQSTLADDDTVRIFIFAGQSNMVGADSKIADVQRFPPFTGLENPQPDVRFSYCIGRKDKRKSEGWVELQSVGGMVGPELSFARKVTKTIDAPIGIIKVAAGGTHLGGDWNPDEPSGFQMYPLAVKWVRDALADLDAQGIPYRLEGFVWHQGENDMFNPEYREAYGKNLANFLASWRRDLEAPKLPFYIGELCTKTIWGMDLRPRMYAISLGQKEVAKNDLLATYVPTSHVGVEIGRGVGLHYHYGTLGQLEHGENYADAYLRSVGVKPKRGRSLQRWSIPAGEKVKLFVLAGHRNMEGERAFVQELAQRKDGKALLWPNPNVPFRFQVGGGVHRSIDWEPLGPAGLYDTFGPELSFARALRQSGLQNFAIAKFTHSGSQVIDWTPEGSEAKSRNLYPSFIAFVTDCLEDLRRKGYEPELGGVFYHVGENDMSWGPFRRGAPERVVSLIRQSRHDLATPDLTWYVSQQRPTDHERVNAIDVTAEFERLFAEEKGVVYRQAFDPPPQEKQLVLDTAGVLWLGEQLAASYIEGEETP